MRKEALFHQANSVWSTIEQSSIIALRFRASCLDDLQISVIEYNRFEDWRERRTHSMMRVMDDSLFAYYQTSFVPSRLGCVYWFQIREGKKVWFYDEYGLRETEPWRLGGFEIPRIQSCDVYEAPSWVKQAVFYQIFPDRFARVEDGQKGLVPWGTIPTWRDKFGGNFKGIQQHLSHLQNLGINAIYFTPIATSPTNHRYDTVDYMKPDPLLGSEEDFRQLVKACHEHGIRVVIDAVFNHCSNQFFAFQDVLKNQEKSPYKDWFILESFPVSVEKKNYQTFGFEPHMPKLNSENEEVRKYLLSVVRHWMDHYPIDGWRLDVADEVDSVFWRQFRDVVKSYGKDKIILGEVFHNPDYYLRGDQFDGVQNYQLFEIVRRYFVRNEVSLNTFKDNLVHLWSMVTDGARDSLLNQLDNHDTSRLFTELKGDVKRLKAAILFQFTYPGMPCVYYGDEIGMEGGNDPDNRRCFDWNPQTWNEEMRTFYRRVIGLRNQERLLQEGTFRILKGNEFLLIYERFVGLDTIVVTMNPTENQVGTFSPFGFTVEKTTKEGTILLMKEGN